MLPLNIYIDGNNLHRSAKSLGFDIDYKKFRGWLRQKYNPDRVYLFIGFISTKTELYEHLRKCGFVLSFKETVVSGSGESMKGNCDSELVLKVMSDFYTRLFYQAVIVSGDGDFVCLANFLLKRTALGGIVVPDEEKCSKLLKRMNTDISSLNDHYQKFSTFQLKPKEAPDAGVPA